MRLISALLLGLALLLGGGCPEPGTEPGPVTGSCEPECEAWQICVDGNCVTGEGRCADDPDCPPDRPVCHQTDRVCVEGGDPCALCEEWQECTEGGECVPKPGRCGEDQDCPFDRPVCHPTDRICVEEDDPCALCEEWQECTGDEECAPGPGRCGSSDDCPPEAPACNTADHVCVEATAPHSISSWPGVVVTSASLAPAFERLALVHTLTGVPTRVVTVEEICDSSCSSTDTRNDVPAAIKAWLAEQEELRYVLLGGRAEDVPSRLVRATYSNSMAGVSFDETFATDFYFSDLSEWDKNGNGVYAEPEDLPAEGESGILDYEADLAVARLPLSSIAEVERYVDKVLHHLTEKNLGAVRNALLLSNVATTLDLGFSTTEIDGGRYFDQPGRTIDIFPADTAFTKLYSLGPTEESPDAVPLTVALQEEAMEAGPNLIVHSGHGEWEFLTTEEFGGNEFSGTRAFGLRNSEYPIMLSCACLAGDFSYEAGPTAGESLLNAPEGGAIGYLGNVSFGLGLGGGSQLIDELLRYAFAVPNSLVGDCLLAAYAGFDYPDSMDFPYVGSVRVVDRSSWEWTRKSTVYLGDPMIPVVTDPSTSPSPTLLISSSTLEGVSEIAISVDPALPGIMMVHVGGSFYRAEISAGEQVVITVPGSPRSISAGFVAAAAMPAFVQQGL